MKMGVLHFHIVVRITASISRRRRKRRSRSRTFSLLHFAKLISTRITVTEGHLGIRHITYEHKSLWTMKKATGNEANTKLWTIIAVAVGVLLYVHRNRSFF